MTEGPSTKTTYHCAGCPHLETEDWVFYEENDGVDRGTYATCKKLNKNIGSYWYSHSFAPDWCPYLENLINDK